MCNPEVPQAASIAGPGRRRSGPGRVWPFLRGRRGGPAVAALAAAAVVALVLGLPGGCEPGGKGRGPVLLFCANDEGVLAACGCPSNPSGGLAKRQALVEQYRRTRPEVLLVDAGDLFPDHRHEVKAKYLARVLARSGYDAIALGDQEFLLGAEYLRRLQREERLPLVCANVRDAAGEPVAPPHVVRSIADLRVGIFAVVADKAYGFPPMEWRTGLRVEDPAEAARREVAALKGCDLVVALSHQPLYASRDLAAEVDGIDLVVSGHDEKVLVKPERIGRTLLVGTGEAGRILGALALGRGKDRRPTLVQEMTELSARVPDAPWVMDLYWVYVKEAKDAPPPDWNLTGIPDRFDTAEACGACHEPEYKQWRTTRHARAYESLRRAGRHEDPECLMCHTMGYGRSGGFVSMEKKAGLGRVTCQACHVVQSDHDEKKVKPEPDINISSRLCMSCHGPVQSPDFDYFVYKPKIRHKKPDDGR